MPFGEKDVLLVNACFSLIAESLTELTKENADQLSAVNKTANVASNQPLNNLILALHLLRCIFMNIDINTPSTIGDCADSPTVFDFIVNHPTF